jgi:hypothetical protein
MFATQAMLSGANVRLHPSPSFIDIELKDQVPDMLTPSSRFETSPEMRPKLSKRGTLIEFK